MGKLRVRETLGHMPAISRIMGDGGLEHTPESTGNTAIRKGGAAKSDAQQGHDDSIGADAAVQSDPDVDHLVNALRGLSAAARKKLLRALEGNR